MIYMASTARDLCILYMHNAARMFSMALCFCSPRAHFNFRDRVIKKLLH